MNFQVDVQDSGEDQLIPEHWMTSRTRSAIEDKNLTVVPIIRFKNGNLHGALAVLVLMISSCLASCVLLALLPALLPAQFFKGDLRGMKLAEVHPTLEV
jgi:hypothetical protein